MLSVNGSIVSINFEALPGGTFAGDAAGLSNIPTANLSGSLPSVIQSNITQVGALTSLTVTGSINTANVFAANTVSATRLSGSLTTAAQPNITSVGTLTSLTVSGGIVSNNIYSQFYGDGGNINNIQGANVVGQVSYAATANAVAVANVSGIGNIALLNLNNNSNTVLYGNGVFATLPPPPATYGNSNVVPLLSSFGSNTVFTTGNVTAGNIITTGVSASTVSGSLTTNAQPNITSVGVLSALAVNGNITGLNVTANHIGNGSQLSSITAANIVGTVASATVAASATSATTAGTVTTAAQPKQENKKPQSTDSDDDKSESGESQPTIS